MFALMLSKSVYPDEMTVQDLVSLLIIPSSPKDSPKINVLKNVLFYSYT